MQWIAMQCDVCIYTYWVCILWYGGVWYCIVRIVLYYIVLHCMVWYCMHVSKLAWKWAMFFEVWSLTFPPRQIRSPGAVLGKAQCPFQHQWLPVPVEASVHRARVGQDLPWFELWLWLYSYQGTVSGTEANGSVQLMVLKCFKDL